MLKKASACIFTFFLAFCAGCGNDTTLVTTEPTLTALDDSYRTLTNTALTEPAPGVLGNDESPGGGELYVSDCDFFTVNAGKVLMEADGGFSYEPPEGFLGVDSFGYVVSDGQDYAAENAIITVEEIPPFNQLNKRTAGDAKADYNFGRSVSISGDYAIVSAYAEDSSGRRIGGAYINHRNEGGDDHWGEVTKLTGSDAGQGESFGSSVAIGGSYAIVGASFENSGGTHAGAAYIFYRDQGGDGMWGQVAKLMAPDAQAYDNFGGSVSISGDYALVGAMYEGSGGDDAGAVYVFQRQPGSVTDWAEAHKLVASDAEASDYFGKSVSISGDYLIVGAAGEDARGDDAGAAYLFHRGGVGANYWREVRKLTASDAQAEDGFGWSVSINGDSAIVGAIEEDSDGSNFGAAYTYRRQDGGVSQWAEEAKLTASDSRSLNTFGKSVSISGDYAIVGAHTTDLSDFWAGVAYLFHRNEGGKGSWGKVASLTASDAQEYDKFGNRVSISEDFAIIGAPGEDSRGDSAGAAYFIRKQ